MSYDRKQGVVRKAAMYKAEPIEETQNLLRRVHSVRDENKPTPGTTKDFLIDIAGKTSAIYMTNTGKFG